MAEILEANLPYWTQEVPELKGQPLVGGRFKYRAGSGFRRRRRYRGGDRKYRIKFGRKVIKYSRGPSGAIKFKGQKHWELNQIRRAVKSIRKSAAHLAITKAHRKFGHFRYAGPGYRTRRRR